VRNIPILSASNLVRRLVRGVDVRGEEVRRTVERIVVKNVGRRKMERMLLRLSENILIVA
jgi:hypothetical protein